MPAGGGSAFGVKKYWTIIKAAWQRSLTYRFSVYSYRVGEIVNVLILLLMWSIIYGNGQIIKGYTLNEMISYLLIGNLVDVFVRNWLHGVVAQDIRNGLLSAFLVKPISYLRYISAREVGRISFAFFMSILSQSALMIVFISKLFINLDARYIAVMAIIVFLAFITELILSFLIGLIAFWTDEVDGIFYTVDRFKNFFSGGYFPLSLLPVFFVKISLALPFAYSFFVPTQLYLKKIDLMVGLKGIIVQLAWILLLYLAVKFIWKKGLKRYEGVGI